MSTGAISLDTAANEIAACNRPNCYAIQNGINSDYSVAGMDSRRLRIASGWPTNHLEQGDYWTRDLVDKWNELLR